MFNMLGCLTLVSLLFSVISISHVLIFQAFLFIYCFTTKVLKVCRTPGPTAFYNYPLFLHAEGLCLGGTFSQECV